MKETIDYQRLRIEALETELKRVNEVLNEISQISTEKARHIKVLIQDENFDKPIEQLNKIY